MSNNLQSVRGMNDMLPQDADTCSPAVVFISLIFWGFLAFLLGFVPYVGFWLAIIPPMLLAWVEIGPVAALLVLVGEGVVNLLAEYILFPHMAGRGLDLSPAVVFISLIFWGWILGGFGVLLAVPLTLTVRMLCELFEANPVDRGPAGARDRVTTGTPPEDRVESPRTPGLREDCG